MAYSGLGKSGAASLLLPEGFRLHTYSLLVSTLVINILSLALPVMTLQVYDRILPSLGSGTLPVLVAGVCLAILMEAVLRLCRAYMIGRSGAVYEHLMMCESMRYVLNAEVSHMHTQSPGEHLQRLSSVGKLKDFYNGYALTVLVELLFVPVFFGLIVYISGFLAAVPFVVLVAFADISFWRGRRIRDALVRREAADSRRFDFIVEALEGIHTVKSFALEKFFARRYESLEAESCRENYDVVEETAETFNTGAVFSHLMVAAVISFGAVQVLQGGLTTGGLIAVLLLSGRMMQPVQKALSLWARYQDYVLARENVSRVFSVPQRAVAGEESAEALPAPAGTMELVHVAFRYPGSSGEEPILKDIHLSVPKGKTLLITGEERAGKSTLLQVMAGRYAPLEGSVRIDGQDIRTYPEQVLPQHVGYISTNSVIFRGTIRDNITCFGQVDEKTARECSVLLNVDKDVARLPGGFDTFLSGNSTDNIPPGLQHRIAMVRVLAHRPRILLFDTADRSLDQEGYARLYSVLARLKGRITMVLVSDDKNIQALADESYVLQRGILLKGGCVPDTANVRPYTGGRR